MPVISGIIRSHRMTSKSPSSDRISLRRVAGQRRDHLELPAEQALEQNQQGGLVVDREDAARGELGLVEADLRGSTRDVTSHGQTDREAGALARSALHRDVTTERRDDVPADGEAQAGSNPHLFAGEEGLEDPLQVPGGDPSSGVRHLGEDVHAIGPGADLDGVALGIALVDGVGRVDEQVQEHLRQLALRGPHRGHIPELHHQPGAELDLVAGHVHPRTRSRGRAGPRSPRSSPPARRCPGCE